MPVIAYVAGPYRDPRGPWFMQENIRRAEAVALELWKEGIPALCPHKNTQWFDGAAPDEVWLSGDLEMLRRCDCVVTVPGWMSSRGATAEVKEADRLGIYVFHWPHYLPRLKEWAASLSVDAPTPAVEPVPAPTTPFSPDCPQCGRERDYNRTCKGYICWPCKQCSCGRSLAE